ncbi:DUF4192 domain-containing protein [Phycicoccus sp. MAQZ13P-2]|uniref:DUF4192 domain-containing protein n=1 Tax=Phycicoccus mangrovi TaxID=2840470 RepID=UPI001BFFDA01|nr:DUF4192 domain-containing protein [Phycicoccus mangrovi]MBT9254841.1 DUF4192 domain-containing protein [Phycicoccus mangrovi]MBT9272954.1 DUF4192 domain-containing protein [Phycicoccus mangrovi]
MSETTTVHGPDELLAVLPYQLGYHPTRSVVVVALDRRRRVHFTARVDLPPEDHVVETVEALLGPVRRELDGPVLLLGYEDEPHASDPLLLALLEALESHGAEVADVAVVRGGRRYSPVCERVCCPPEGVPLPDPHAVPAVAELVARGLAPLADRSAVDGLVAPDAEQASAVGAWLPLPALDRRSRRGSARVRREAVRAWALVLARPEAVGRRRHEPTPEVLARAVEGLRDIGLRDALIAWVAPGVVPRGLLDAVVVALLERHLPRWAGMGTWAHVDREVEGRRELLERLLALARAVPDERPDDAAAVCTTAAQLAWQLGDGALARAALERALRVEPGYRLARLLSGVVEHGLRPETLTRAGEAAPGAGRLRRAG